MNKERVASLIHELLLELGEDPLREGLKKTPMRVAKAWDFLSKGYSENLEGVINNAVYESQANNMIIVRDIEIYSCCEHHMLPFYGSCNIGYIANKHVLGVSKLARIVDHFARRLQIQEHLTAQIAHAVMDTVKAEGVGVIMNCKHMCMMMRGVEKQHSAMITSSVLGSFHDDLPTRQEFISLVGNQH